MELAADDIVRAVVHQPPVASRLHRAKHQKGLHRTQRSSEACSGPRTAKGPAQGQSPVWRPAQGLELQRGLLKAKVQEGQVQRGPAQGQISEEACAGPSSKAKREHKGSAANAKMGVASTQVWSALSTKKWRSLFRESCNAVCR